MLALGEIRRHEACPFRFRSACVAARMSSDAHVPYVSDARCVDDAYLRLL
jgi:hypothetical protein